MHRKPNGLGVALQKLMKEFDSPPVLQFLTIIYPRSLGGLRSHT